VHVGVCFAAPLLALVVVQTHPSWKKKLSIVAVGILAVGGSWDIADAAAREFRERSVIVRGEMTALMQVSDPVADGYQPDAARAPQISFGRFAEFAGRFDVPLLSPSEIRRSPEFVRFEMDRVYLEAAGVKMVNGVQPSGWSCEESQPNDVVKIAAGDELWVSGVHSLEIRRMAKQPHSLVPSSPGIAATLRFGQDSNPRPWTVRLVSAGPTQLCRPGS
jgi:hypothetical protein